MRVIVGTDNGCIRGIAVEEKKVILSIGKPVAGQEVDNLCWGSSQEEVCFSLKNGTVKLYATDKLEGTALWTLDTAVRQRGLFVFSGSSPSESGDLMIYNQDQTEQTFKPLSVGSPIAKMRVDHAMRIAVGGKERDLAVWDIEKRSPTWTAKNVPNDSLDLRVPVWIKDLQFYRDVNGKKEDRIVVSTAYHQIRIYDLKAGRRPQVNVEIGESPLNTIVLSPDNTTVTVGDALGHIYKLDLRMNCRLLGTFRGSSGAIRAIDHHATESAVVSAGLDRFVRIHDSVSRKLLHKVYLKHRLNCVLFADEGPISFNSQEADEAERRRKEEEEQEDAEAEEIDRMLESMRPVPEEAANGEDDEDDENDDEAKEQLPEKKKESKAQKREAAKQIKNRKVKQRKQAKKEREENE